MNRFKNAIIRIIMYILIFIAIVYIYTKFFPWEANDILSIAAIVISIIAFTENLLSNELEYKTELSINNIVVEARKSEYKEEFYDVDYYFTISNLGDKVAKNVELNFNFDIKSFSDATNYLNIMYAINEYNNRNFIQYNCNYASYDYEIKNKYKINYIYGNRDIKMRLPVYIGDLICMYVIYCLDGHKVDFPIVKLECRYNDFNDKQRIQNFDLKFEYDSISDINFRGMIYIEPTK